MKNTGWPDLECIYDEHNIKTRQVQCNTMLRMGFPNDQEHFIGYSGTFGSHCSNRTIDGSLFAPSMNSSGVNFIYNCKFWITIKSLICLSIYLCIYLYEFLQYATKFFIFMFLVLFYLFLYWVNDNNVLL